jgi:outer membrane immunogenic protein
MTLTKSGAAAIAILALAGLRQASAADMPAALPIYRPPPSVVAQNWTGCYLGANVGGGWSKFNYVDPAGPTTFAVHTADGVVGGGQAGCDLQLGPIVLGAGGMFDGSGIDGQSTGAFGGATSKVPWFGNVMGRVGVAVMPNALVYGKGGFGWVGDRLRTTTSTGIETAFANPTRSGWLAGIGIDWMFAPGWSVFVEYDYMGLGTDPITFTTVGTPATTFPVNVTQSMQTILFGVNFRFGTGAPLFARY